MSKLDDIISGLPVTASAKILDVGCGNGFLIAELQKKFKYVVGIDISRGLLKKAKANLLHRQEVGENKVDFCVASAAQIPFKQRSFNIVIFSELIEHIDNVEAVFDEAQYILKKEGMLILTIPVWWVVAVITFFNKDFMKFSGHVQRFKLKETKELLGKYGFEIVKIMNYYSEWAVIYTIEAIFSQRFSDCDRRYDKYETIPKESCWDKIEQLMKRVVRRMEKAAFTDMMINFLNLIYPKSYIFLCKKAGD
ncbi:MAG: class I SAM-dependent methyltransferase [Omnitrophica bacterium]|nr:class I SAM-dependent methyltransferase [Candidatus Omnitrophota bacterium]